MAVSRCICFWQDNLFSSLYIIVSCTTFSDSKSDSQTVKPIKKISLKKRGKTSAKKKTFIVKLNRIHMRKSRVHCIIDVTPKTGYKNPLVTKKIFKTSNYLRVKC